MEPETHEPGPNLVTSGYSRPGARDGITVELCICRHESESSWSLAVVNSAGTSIVWYELFTTDFDANSEFLRTVDDEGMAAFLDSGKVIPFPRRPEQ